MTTLLEKLENVKNRIGLVGTRLSLSRPDSGESISEHITTDWRDIVISVKNGLDLAPDEETKRYLTRVKSEDPLETVTTDLLYHGCGHRELPTETGLGCPHTVENHDAILNGITRAVKEKGKTGLEKYLANAFEDVLDNTNARKHTRHAGQILFWNNSGLENQGKFTKFYEAFVKINLALWGNVEDATLLRRFFSNTEEVNNSVRAFKDYLKRKSGRKLLVRAYEKEALFDSLFDKEGWEDMAYQFALATADLLDNPDEPLCFGKPNDEESHFDRQIKLPQVQEDIAYKRYNGKKGTSEHTDPLLQLDSLYRKISKMIPVKTLSYVKASGLPVAFHGRRNPREEEDVRVNRIKGVGLNENGELGLKVARHEINYPATYKVHPRRFPRLRIALLDTSGSMLEAPDQGDVGSTLFIPWGDKSKYHFALKGIYGIDNFLERQGIASYVQCETVTFNAETRRSGRRKFRSEEEKRALLRKPSGGTAINVQTLKQATSEKSLLISVSDGEIQNWGEIKSEYESTIKGLDYVHIHIGPKNEFTKDLENFGVKVHYVNGDEDLSRIMIDAASKYYKVNPEEQT